MFVLLPIMFFIVTKFIIWHFGEYYLPILSVVYSIIELTVVFEASGEAMRPILPIYNAENNTNALKDLLVHSFIINLLLGLVFSVFLLTLGGLIPDVFYIDDPSLNEICTTGLKLYAIGCPGMAIASELNSYFLNTGRTKLALYESILNQLVSIVILVFTFGMLFGINGIWFGFAAAPYLTLAVLVVTVFIMVCKGKIATPLPQKSVNILTETIDLQNNEFMEYVYSVHDFLLQHGVDSKTCNRVELTLEESLVLLRDANLKDAKGKQRKDTTAECTVHVYDEAVDLSIWDSGIVFDITDENMGIKDLHS